MSGKIYLIPNTLGESETKSVFPELNFAIVKSIKHFIVEDVRTARRFLKKMDKEIDIDTLTFYTLNKHTSPEEISTYLAPALAGSNMGVISEAGCPCIADPGAEIVKIAQKKGLRSIPLVGPSSILMGLMASGFNGQSFAFVGYLPIEDGDRTNRIKSLEKRAKIERQSQIFIETPYRNIKMMESLLSTLQANTLVCVACDVTLETEMIITKTVAEWKKKPLPEINKRPTVFIIYC
ncbi:MAG: SAM-dependent methyltransferase [Paludibacteraceae bacterium]|nr:SAM-dependent methyltransferase [Paludibacteraceae bacterium]